MIKICNNEINPRSIIAGPDFVSGWREDLKTEDYHADKSAINSSSLKHATKSEYSFAHNFWGNPKEPTEFMKFGTLYHMAQLEPMKFKEKYIVEPIFEGLTADGKMSTRSASAKKKRAEWLAEIPKDAVVVTEDERDRILSMIDSVASHPTASQLLKDGKPEMIGYWKKSVKYNDEDMTEEPLEIALRMMGDFLRFDLGILADLKTCQDSSWESFRRTHVEGLGAFLQMAQYKDGVQSITGAPVENCAWIAVESKFPFETAVHEVDYEYDVIGKFQYEQNLKKIKRAIESNCFPQAQLYSVKGEVSPWFRKKYQLKGVILNGE